MRKFVYLVLFVMITCVIGITSETSAVTVAYWRFDEIYNPTIDTSETGLPMADGNPVPDSDGSTVWRKGVHDWSGNGNHLTTWDHGWAGMDWSSDIPTAQVPLTGIENLLSIKNAGNWPAAMTWSSQSNPSGIDAQAITPAQFTVEASFRADELGGFRTIVGRDGQNVWTEDTWDPWNWAPFYLSVRPDLQVAVEFVDVSGFQYTVESDPGIVEVDKWYHIVGVSDGSTLSLYLNNNLVGQMDITVKGSPDTSLAIGESGPDWEAGAWTLGRGLWGGGHVDRWFGNLDEVRISDTALEPCQFLMAGIPEPATMVLLGFGSLVLLRRRK